MPDYSFAAPAVYATEAKDDQPIHRSRHRQNGSRPGPSLQINPMTDLTPSNSLKTDRAAYLVLGMHRSGTSAMTRVLALAGASLPSDVMRSDEFNERGYFESQEVTHFNDERLWAEKSAWDDPFHHRYEALADEADWRDRARKVFRKEYARRKHPLLKDPRISILMPLWRSVLEAEGIGARCVIPVRHPLAVAESLANRDQFPHLKSILLWIAYMVATEANTRDLPRAIISYDSLLDDWRAQIARLEGMLGTPLPNLSRRAETQIDGFLSPSLRHYPTTGSLAEYGEVGRAAQGVLDWFNSAASGHPTDRTPLMQADAMLSSLKAEVGLLISPITSELHAARRELTLLRTELFLARPALATLQHERDRIESEVDGQLARF
jgi:hypothetical protein